MLGFAGDQVIKDHVFKEEDQGGCPAYKTLATIIHQSPRFCRNFDHIFTFKPDNYIFVTLRIIYLPTCFSTLPSWCLLPPPPPPPLFLGGGGGWDCTSSASTMAFSISLLICFCSDLMKYEKPNRGTTQVAICCNGWVLGIWVTVGSKRTWRKPASGLHSVHAKQT